MTEDGAGNGSWNRPVKNMDITGTDGCERNPYDGVFGADDVRNRPFFEPQDSIAFVDGGFHGFLCVVIV